MSATPPDTLNEIGVLKRREVEARILLPVLEALGQEFGRERVLSIVRDVIVDIAREQGETLAAQLGGRELDAFARGMEQWKRGNALDMEVLEQSPERYDFNVTRCGYADMYRSLGVPELGALLSCNRDYALIEGFNREATLTRTQTIMEGAPHCDFRFRLKRPSS